MHIAIDATCWWNQRGFGRFTRELLSALFALPTEHHFSLLIDQEPDAEMLRSNVSIVQVKPSRPVTEAAVADGNRSPKDLIVFTRAVAKLKPDVMFFPAVYSWFPVPWRLPAVVTLHDAIAEHYPKLIFANWRSRLFWGLKMKLACWQAQRFLTVSQAARDEIVRYLGIKTALIDVISEAPNACFQPLHDSQLINQARQQAGLSQQSRLLIYVGGFAPHKNLDGLLRGFALALADARLHDLQLAMVGDLAGAGFHTNQQQLADQARNHSLLRERVIFTGFIPDQPLAALYSDALAGVMPAFSEGFGLPAVEAMACGTPVLASRRGSLPEVVGDAGLFFEPDDEQQIARSISAIASDHELLTNKRQQAVQQAARFSWSTAAEQTLRCLEDCINQR